MVWLIFTNAPVGLCLGIFVAFAFDT